MIFALCCGSETS